MDPVRSMMFTPGNRLDLLEKALRSGTDAVIVELFGRDGVISVKDDHRDVLMASHEEVASPYTGTLMNVAMLGSFMPGDWALGEHFGAMQEEIHAFINSVGTGRRNPILATGEEGLNVLTISRAVDEAAKTREVMSMSWVE